MKKLIIALAACLVCGAAIAQQYDSDNDPNQNFRNGMNFLSAASGIIAQQQQALYNQQQYQQQQQQQQQFPTQTNCRVYAGNQVQCFTMGR